MPDLSGPTAQPEMEGCEKRKGSEKQLTLSDSMYRGLREMVGGLSEGVNDTSAVYIYRKIDLQLCKWVEREANNFPQKTHLCQSPNTRA